MTFRLVDLLRNRPRTVPADPPQKASCPRTDKIRYRYREDARSELANLQARDLQPERLVVYRCWSCGDFHIGHKS